MPGLIGNMFQPDDGDVQQSSQDTTRSGDADTGIAASPSVGIGMEGSYENSDGSTGEWSNDTSVGVDVDVDAAFNTATTLATDGFSASE